MKNNIYTYNPELGDAFMNLYKKIRKIEKKTTDAEKARIYTCISVVMPDELSEIKRVIDRAQNLYNTFIPAVNNTIQASSNYMMNVNAAEKAIDEMNMIAELFNYVRKKNGIRDDADVPMYLIGELKSAFESHDFELFEKLVMTNADDPYCFNYINDLVLSKMNESNDNTKEGQSSEACDQEDNASIIEQLDEVFNDVSNDEESDTLSDDINTEPEKADESADKPEEETEELLDPSIVTKLPDPDDFDNFISEVFQSLINSSSSPSQLLSKLNNKYKTNVSLVSLMYSCNQIRNTSTAVSATHIAAILSMDMRNKEGNIDTPDPSVSLSADELRFICDELSYKYRSEIVDDVLNKFGTHINTWEIGAISYVLINRLNGNYMGNFNALHEDLLNYRSFFNLPTDEPTTPRVKRKRRKKVEE